MVRPRRLHHHHRSLPLGHVVEHAVQLPKVCNRIRFGEPPSTPLSSRPRTVANRLANLCPPRKSPPRLIVGALFVISKTATRRPPVKLDDDFTLLQHALHELTYKKPGRRPTTSTESAKASKRVMLWVLTFTKLASPLHSTARAEHDNSIENGHIAMTDREC